MGRIFKGICEVAVVLGSFARDGIRFLKGCVFSRTSLAAENLFLRKQLSFYQEHQIRPRRLTNSARVALVFWSRFFEWRSALVFARHSHGNYRKVWAESKHRAAKVFAIHLLETQRFRFLIA